MEPDDDKVKSKNGNGVRISVTLPRELFQRIEYDRGEHIPRSRYISGMLKEAYEHNIRLK